MKSPRHTKVLLRKQVNKPRKTSDTKMQKKFELLMNNGGDIELEMRLMESKLRKINKE